VVAALLFASLGGGIHAANDTAAATNATFARTDPAPAYLTWGTDSTLPAPTGQGLTVAHNRAQLEDLRDTTLTSELNLSTLGHIHGLGLGCLGDTVS